MRRRVSSDLGVSRLPGRGIRVFDDTTRRRVSSVLGVSGPSRHGIRVFDDTIHRRVSSVLEIIEPHGPKSGFLMILCVA